MKIIQFEIVKDNGTTVVMPDVKSFTVSPLFCDIGTVDFSMPASAAGFAYLRDEILGNRDVVVALRVDGLRVDALLAEVDSMEGNDADTGEDAGVWTFHGRFIGHRFDEALVAPRASDPLELVVVDYTAGELMGQLLAESAARGAGVLTEFTHSFTNTLDSNGVAWTKQISISISPGTTYLEMLKALESLQMAEFEFDGYELKLYQWGTLGIDRTLTNPPLIFRRGRDLTESPLKVTLRDAATTLLTAGGEGAYVETSDATALANRGRRIERYVSQGNVTDPGTLAAYSQLRLDGLKTSKLEKTHGLTFDAPGTPQPMDDFTTGDWAYTDVDGTLVRYRIKQWVVTASDDTPISGSVVLNDLIAERAADLARRVNGITGGTTVLGTSKAEPVPLDVYNGIGPMAPASMALTSLAYVDADGATQAQVTASWTAVTQNSDGSVIDDLDEYIVQYKAVSDTEWSSAGSVPSSQTSMSWSPMLTSLSISGRVAARDRAGNLSPWRGASNITTASDSTAPPTPSTPDATSYLGLARAAWDGKGSVGQAMPGDFSHVEVHWSTVFNFTPTGATLTDRLDAAGPSFYSGPYGVTVYCKFVAFDRSGNSSAASAQDVATPSQVVTGDVADGVITTAKIANLAVNDAQIGNVSAGKITVGILAADITVSARIKTADTGARVELNSTGLKAYDSSGANTVFINAADGSILAVGTISTALTGERIVFNSSSTNPEIQFWSGASSRYATQSSQNDMTGGTNILMRGSNQSGNTRHGEMELRSNGVLLYYGDDAETWAGRSELHLLQGLVRAMVGGEQSADFLPNQVRATQYAGVSGQQAIMRTFSGNNFWVDWAGGRLRFYIDITEICSFPIGFAP